MWSIQQRSAMTTPKVVEKGVVLYKINARLWCSLNDGSFRKAFDAGIEAGFLGD